MKQRITIVAVLLTVLAPTAGFCQFPWGALNNTLNQFNQSVALQQNEQALRIQQEYLRQQAQELDRRNQLMQQEINLKKQTLPQNNLDKVKCLNEWQSIKQMAEVTENINLLTLNWKYDWSAPAELKNKFLHTVAFVDFCINDTVRRIDIKKNGELVAVADPKTLTLKVLK